MKSNVTDAFLLDAFKQACEKSQGVDSYEDQDWFSLSLGFFAAYDVIGDRAWDLALEARYDHEYWN